MAPIAQTTKGDNMEQQLILIQVNQSTLDVLELIQNEKLWFQRLEIPSTRRQAYNEKPKRRKDFRSSMRLTAEGGKTLKARRPGITVDMQAKALQLVKASKNMTRIQLTHELMAAFPEKKTSISPVISDMLRQKALRAADANGQAT